MYIYNITYFQCVLTLKNELQQLQRCNGCGNNNLHLVDRKQCSCFGLREIEFWAMKSAAFYFQKSDFWL